MLVTPWKWVTCAALLGILFWCSAPNRGALLLLLLVVWTVAMGVFAYLNLIARHLWIPSLLALAGLFGSVLFLAIPAYAALGTNLAALSLFIVSLAALQKRHLAIALVKDRVG